MITDAAKDYYSRLQSLGLSHDEIITLLDCYLSEGKIVTDQLLSVVNEILGNS